MTNHVFGEFQDRRYNEYFIRFLTWLFVALVREFCCGELKKIRYKLIGGKIGDKERISR